MTDNQYPRDPDWVMYIEQSKTLTVEEMTVREKVVREYMFDRSWYNACMRCGFRAEFAEDNARRFQTDPYCIWRVKQLSLEQSNNLVNGNEAAVSNEKSEILAMLRKEASYYGPGSSQAARVSALGKLAQLLGMEPPKQNKVELKTPGVMVVPAIASVEDWENTAMNAQEKLRDDTMNGVPPVVH